MFNALLLCATVGLALAACERKASTVFAGPRLLAGVEVPASVLNRGKTLYDRHCASCHGDTGKGDGPAARNLVPRPASFAGAVFPRTTRDNPTALPSDDALIQLMRSGVPGTAMPAWRTLGNTDLRAVVHFLKTLSPRWNTPAGRQDAVLQGSKPSGTVRAPLRVSVDSGANTLIIQSIPKRHDR